MKTQGLIVPLVTPLTGAGDLDRRAMGRLLRHVEAGRADGVFVLGTTGEGTSFPYAMRKQVVELICQTKLRMDVSVCVSDNCLDGSIDLAVHAADAGADTIAATIPSYYRLSADEIVCYFRSLARASPLPLVLYNFPQMTKTPIPLRAVEQLAQESNIVGIKDSGGDPAYLESMRPLQEKHGFALLVGDESLIVKTLQWGADGAVCGSANIAPALFRRLIDAVMTANEADVSLASRQVETLHDLYRVSDTWSRYITVNKSVLERMGICRRHVAAPLIMHDENVDRRIDLVVKRLVADGVLSSKRLRHSTRPFAQQPA